MNTEMAIKFFGSKSAIARALGISQVAVTRWGNTVPEKRAARLSHITGGQLEYDPSFYENNDRAKRAGNLTDETQSAG
ncbi:Cro/CI family transcriptional regulator [Kosakonia sacchari]|uniref:Cro/CI family transcriptional regulator n=1 Tax=Kosakonia sacchari TaxID=1158459 RepID=UPI001585548F|nr:Cro/CI family transcriptional regulator [Kosakonia sacchari]NUL36602.1 helix-turn-helix domain-containing protein [Kosakonia sacchari]